MTTLHAGDAWAHVARNNDEGSLDKRTEADRQEAFAAFGQSRPEMGVQAVEVAQQERDPGSILNWIERLIRRRRQTAEIALGDGSVLPFPEAGIMGRRYDWGPFIALLVHNMGAGPCRISSMLREDPARWAGLTDLLGEGGFRLAKNRPTVEMPAHGHLWLRVQR